MDLVSVSLKVVLVGCIALFCWMEYPVAMKTINSYIDNRIDEHTAASINIPAPAPPIKELDGYDLNRQPIP